MKKPAAWEWKLGMTKLQAAVFSTPTNGATHSSEAKVENFKTTQIELSSRRTKSKPRPASAILRQRSAEQENSAHAALLDVAHAFTPRVEDTASDTLLLDLAGLERLYGAPATMARDLASRVNAVALEANIALAANPEAALHAARGFSGTTVLPAGEEAHRLGVLPLQVLLDAFDISLKNGSASDREREKLREQMLDTLERWGVRDFRTLALLPEHALASRLGETGTHLQRLARGAGMRTLALCEPATHFEEAMELESPVETLEPLSFVLNRLLEQLCARLEARALAVQELHLRLRLERRVADEETTDRAGISRSFIPHCGKCKHGGAHFAPAGGHARYQGFSQAAAVGISGTSAGRSHHKSMDRSRASASPFGAARTFPACYS